MNLKGFPHSDIPGSKLVCSSPGLIAAYRALHRLLAPRHSPYALSSLTIQVSNSERPACADPSALDIPSSHCVRPNAVKAFCQIVCSEKNYRLQDIQLSNSGPQAPGLRPQNMVENTGLEPVTSWLQTRRSPS